MVDKITPDDMAKASRKAIPKTTQAWMAEVAGVTKLIDQKVKLREQSGVKWLESVKRYNRARLAVLAKNLPPGLSKALALKIVSEIQSRLL